MFPLTYYSIIWGMGAQPVTTFPSAPCIPVGCMNSPHQWNVCGRSAYCFWTKTVKQMCLLHPLFHSLLAIPQESWDSEEGKGHIVGGAWLPESPYGRELHGT